MAELHSSRITILDTRQLDAILFDLDGVVTQTATLHAEAWKQVFDAYLADCAARRGESWQPFDSDSDYLWYVDGKPRYDGVRSFLTARGIDLPEGEPDDPPEGETICGLGNAKNALFLARLHSTGVTVYDSTVALIQHAKALGLRVAVISSSKHCVEVLAAAALTDVFDACVDGIESARLGLQGKPAPAIFLEAAQRLHVVPERAAVVEDAIAGVQAGRAGQFAYVIGVDRGNNAAALRAHGADLVVRDLSELGLSQEPSGSAPLLLPSALKQLQAIRRATCNKRLAIFLDYDGTLTPIVPRPEDAHLSESMRTALADLADKYPVAIVSGRDLTDVRNRIGLTTLYYAGSHGFEIAGPHALHAIYGPARAFLVALDTAEHALHDQLDGIVGVQIERKHFAIAVHYRHVSEDEVDMVLGRVASIRDIHATLRQTGGKKVVELRPNLDWHKGTALYWLLEVMQLPRESALPVYIGDDVTDEDAFAAIQQNGVGILVADTPQPTSARYGVADTQAVHDLLVTLAQMRPEETEG